MERGLNQRVTYWPPIGEDKYGQTQFGAPRILSARWEDRNEEAVTLSGETILSKAVIYVDTDLLVEGRIAQGDLRELTDPTLTSAAQEIRIFRSIPDLRNATAERRAII